MYVMSMIKRVGVIFSIGRWYDKEVLGRWVGSGGRGLGRCVE